jgi:hypothetical protein
MVKGSLRTGKSWKGLLTLVFTLGNAYIWKALDEPAPLLVPW